MSVTVRRISICLCSYVYRCNERVALVIEMIWLCWTILYHSTVVLEDAVIRF